MYSLEDVIKKEGGIVRGEGGLCPGGVCPGGVPVRGGNCPGGGMSGYPLWLSFDELKIYILYNGGKRTRGRTSEKTAIVGVEGCGHYYRPTSHYAMAQLKEKRLSRP